MLISSLDNSRIKEVIKLRDKKYSLSKGLYIVEGEHLVVEAFKNNLLYELFVLEGNEKDYRYAYDLVTEKVMKKLSDLKSTPRVLGVVSMKETKDLGNKIVLLDNVQDPGNAGTIIRNAVAFGVDTIIFSKESVNPYNEKVVRSAQGMIFNVNIIVDDLPKRIKEIKEKNIKVIGTSLKTKRNVSSMPKYEKYAVVFGNEGNGMSDEISKMCDVLYKIGMDNKCESLNVGVSCGIILYKLFEG